MTDITKIQFWNDLKTQCGKMTLFTYFENMYHLNKVVLNSEEVLNYNEYWERILKKNEKEIWKKIAANKDILIFFTNNKLWLYIVHNITFDEFWDIVVGINFAIIIGFTTFIFTNWITDNNGYNYEHNNFMIHEHGFDEDSKPTTIWDFAHRNIKSKIFWEKVKDNRTDEYDKYDKYLKSLQKGGYNYKHKAEKYKHKRIQLMKILS